MWIYDIDWDWDISEEVDYELQQNQRQFLTYLGMTVPDADSLGVVLEKLIKDLPSKFDYEETFMPQIPHRVQAPMDLEDEEEIADWLSDTYGYCVNSFKVSELGEALVSQGIYGTIQVENKLTDEDIHNLTLGLKQVLYEYNVACEKIVDIHFNLIREETPFLYTFQANAYCNVTIATEIQNDKIIDTIIGTLVPDMRQAIKDENDLDTMECAMLKQNRITSFSCWGNPTSQSEFISINRYVGG